MKKIIVILFLLLPSFLVFGQEKLMKDLDKDGKKDTVFLDKETSSIVCRLSTQNYAKIYSQPIGILNDQSGIVDAKNGFVFFNDWMRAGYKCQFRYNEKTKKVQLIGMSTYEFGNAANDGSGEASVNLLTNDYIGNWNYYDYLANNEEGELVKIPSIRTKMIFKTVNLGAFSEEVYFEFGERSAEFYQSFKAKEMKRRKTKK